MNTLMLVLVTILVGVAWAGISEEDGKKFIEGVDKKIHTLIQDVIAKKWAANTAVKANKEKATKELDEANKKVRDYQNEVFPQVLLFPWKTYKNPNTKNLFSNFFYSYANVLSGEKKTKYDKITEDINNLDDKVLLKEYKSADNKPKLKSKDVDTKADNDFKNAEEMSFYWKEYHDALGKPVKDLFTQLVALENDNAHLLKYSNAAEFYETPYEVDNFETTMHDLYKKIEPLYQELHAYIRYKLWDATGRKNNIVDPKGPIPASLLGSKWGSDASALYDLLVPYPKKSYSLDFSSQMKTKGYTSKKMAEIAESFYESLGFSKMPADFWTKSVFDNKDSCSQRNYDFYNGKDYRMVFCSELYSLDFSSMLSSLGYIEYGIATKDLPYLFKSQSNVACSYAFDNVMQSFALSPDYLKSLGLYDSNFVIDKEILINSLLNDALSDLFNMPWTYSLDLWRLSVFKGKTTPKNYNCEYWKTRTNLQGVDPPVTRDNNDFDVGVHTWFLTGGQYMQNYISKFITYDMIYGLCKAAGHYDPKTKPDNHLKFCNINNSKAAGEKLKEMMALGSSVPWYVALEKVTGHKNLDASGLLEYYKPLFEWLQEQNKKNQVTVGWNNGHNRCH